jgi:hypothetical protein
MRMLPMVIAAAIAALAVAACDRAGPAEKAGRSIDQAGEKASKAIEKTAKDVKDAVSDKKK